MTMEALRLKRAIVLLSGGIDSATALYWTRRETDDVHSLNMLYAQASVREAEASKKLAEAANVKEHFSVQLPFFREIQARYHPVRSPTVNPAYVPARNMVFYSVAAAYAEVIEADTIIFGSNAEDAQQLPDANQQFIRHMNELIQFGTRVGAEGRSLSILNPLIDHTKLDVLRLAKELDVPLELTWSCYEDVVKPCGQCRGCRSRNGVFTQLGIPDPLEKVTQN
jgi:7-cyano-7-deazaguanine synthase